jgi:hypothetical protein
MRKGVKKYHQTKIDVFLFFRPFQSHMPKKTLFKKIFSIFENWTFLKMSKIDFGPELFLKIVGKKEYIKTT